MKTKANQTDTKLTKDNEMVKKKVDYLVLFGTAKLIKRITV